jgi:hypothetical protein
MAENYKIFDVVAGFHADPKGLTDATVAFRKAYQAACASEADQIPSRILVPKGRYRLRRALPNPQNSKRG